MVKMACAELLDGRRHPILACHPDSAAGAGALAFELVVGQ